MNAPNPSATAVGAMAGVGPRREPEALGRGAGRLDRRPPGRAARSRDRHVRVLPPIERQRPGTEGRLGDARILAEQPPIATGRRPWTATLTDAGETTPGSLRFGPARADRRGTIASPGSAPSPPRSSEPA